MIAEVKPDNWYVLITDIHSEYNTAQKLDALGFMVYCPSEPTFIQWEGNHKGCLFRCFVVVSLFQAIRISCLPHFRSLGELSYLMMKADLFLLLH